MIPTIGTALVLGAFGSVHCVAMCGGIAGALSMARDGVGGKKSGVWLRHACYGVGRVASYVVAGAFVGSLGLVLGSVLGAKGTLLLRAAAAVLLVLLGLQLGGWWSGLAHVERVGASLWRRIAPPLLPTRPDRASALASLGIGVVWGWLPCGLVYSTLAWAGASGNPIESSVAMGAFGLGTLPGVWLVGVGASPLARLTRERGVRELAGATVIAMAIWTVIAAAEAGRGGRPSCHDEPAAARPTVSAETGRLEVQHGVDRHTVFGDVLAVER
jgi:hypothetical protein